MIHACYVQPEKAVDDNLVIDGSEANHIRKVMRLKRGDPIIAVDGCGNGYKAEIGRISRRKIECKLLTRIRHFGRSYKSCDRIGCIAIYPDDYRKIKGQIR